MRQTIMFTKKNMTVDLHSITFYIDLNLFYKEKYAHFIMFTWLILCSDMKINDYNSHMNLGTDRYVKGINLRL